MKKIAVVIVGLLLALPVLAKDLTVRLNIAQIQALKEQEYNGDELYFNVAEYTKQGVQQFYRVPERPIYLRSGHLEKVKDFNLWHKTLQEGQSAQVIISLIEQDLAPWDLDDLIGEVKLKLKNQNGKLITDWVMLNTDKHGEIIAHIKSEQRRFELNGSGARYLLDFQLSSS